MTIMSKCHDNLILIHRHEPRPDVIAFLDLADEYPPVADVSGTRFLDDSRDDILDPVVFHDNLDHDFRQQRNFVFVPAINERLAALAAVSLCFRDRHAGRDKLQRVDDFFKLERLDDALNEFH